MLSGKVGLVFGAANKRSIAWGVVEAWVAAGAHVHVVCQSERFLPALRTLIALQEARVGITPQRGTNAAEGPAELPSAGLGGKVAGLHVCDVTDDAAIAALFARLETDDESLRTGSPLHAMLHSVWTYALLDIVRPSHLHTIIILIL